MANYVHKTGYVVYNQDKDAYISGYGYDGSGTKVTYYNVNLECAKVWLTSKGARAACLPHEVPVRVKLDAKGHAHATSD